ncbi:hypothetical protein MIND_00286000 [Mycena indigotica]|uniref:F-box domain-containing protein n=1 Tax=Mycena indigotica TaxID=2126181 RepID=A0A8H6T9B8_9AGAR|nr:uncharacterized protein MIND_00286000 [Mycena indigotica]KAF7312712.1 hypothetical protein MIND_00286000 [Mycena indigotica]
MASSAGEVVLPVSESPVLELLDNNVEPTAEQIELARSAILRAKSALESLDITCQGNAETQRRLLGDFIASHERVLAPIRQLPTELCHEIASHLSSHSERDKPDELWALASSCRCWREILKDIPRHIGAVWFSNSSSSLEIHNTIRSTLGQVNATGIAAFTFFTQYIIYPFLSKILPHIIQRAISLRMDVSGGLLEHINFFAAGQPFVNVRLLSLFPHHMHINSGSPVLVNLLFLFPSVNHLRINVPHGMNPHVLWSILPQLQTCEVYHSRLADILPYAAGSGTPLTLTRLAFIECEGDSPRPKSCNLGSQQLVFQDCYPSFISDIMKLVVPAPLQKLVIQIPHDIQSVSNNPIHAATYLAEAARYLDRFSNITELTISLHMHGTISAKVVIERTIGGLKTVLEAAHSLNCLTHLRLGLAPLSVPTPVLEILADERLMPHIRVLSLSECKYFKVATLRAINRARNHRLGQDHRLEKLVVDTLQMIQPPELLTELRNSGLQVVASAPSQPSSVVFEPER